MTSDKPNTWADIVGPCYNAASLARELGWTVEQVAAAVNSFDLLELETSDSVLLYPAFQVWEGRLVDGLGDVLRELGTGTKSTWTWAQWLNTAVDDETGEDALSAIRQLLAGQYDDVMRDARHAAAAWRS